MPVHPDARVDPTAIVDPAADIGPNVWIKERCIVGARVIIDKGATIYADTVLGAGTHIGRNATVMWRCRTGKDARVGDFATMQPEEVLPDRGSIPGARHMAEARVMQYGIESGEDLDWLYDYTAEYPDLRPGLPNPVPVVSVSDEQADRYEFSDGSALIHLQDVWSYGVHRDLIEAANAALNGQRAHPEAVGWPGRKGCMDPAGIYADRACPYLPDLGKYLQDGRFAGRSWHLDPYAADRDFGSRARVHPASAARPAAPSR